MAVPELTKFFCKLGNCLDDQGNLFFCQKERHYFQECPFFLPQNAHSRAKMRKCKLAVSFYRGNFPLSGQAAGLSGAVLREISVPVLVGRGAGAQETQGDGAGGGDLMPGSGGD